jgi:hypothetical protein
LNRNGDGSILYIGSVSVCVRRPTSYARAALTNVAVTWGFIACRFYSVCYCSKPSLCQWATFELLSAPFGSAGACQFSEAVSYYASHSFSVCTSNKKLSVANHLYISVQPLSYSSCTGSDLVHVYFLADISLRVRAARVRGSNQVLLRVTLIFSVHQPQKAHGSQPSLYQCATFELFFMRRK